MDRLKRYHQPSSCQQLTPSSLFPQSSSTPFQAAFTFFDRCSSITECLNPSEWRVLLKHEQVLKSMGKKPQTDRQTLWLPACILSHLGSLDLVSSSVCVPHPSQCRVGPPLLLQKLSFILNFMSRYNALRSWMTLLAQQYFQFRARLEFPLARRGEEILSDF